MEPPDYIEAIKTEDRLILAAIYRQFFPMIRKMVQETGGSEADAKDVFQDAVMVIFHQAIKGGFQLTSQFSTYLYSVAFNLWRSRQKKKSFREVSIPDDAAYILEELSEDDDKIEQWQLYYRAFARLSEDCRALLLLFYEKKSMVEIAERMGYASENYASRRKHTCKERLVELVKSYPEYQELRIR